MHHKTVQDAMSSTPRTIESSTPLQEAARLMRDENVGSLPIVEGDRLVGMLAQADVAKHSGEDARTGQMVEEISR